MTVLSRGARARRSGRRPGWLLLTALLILAIGASSALVFTNRVELLKLAVILSLWAAVIAAFVSVIYRRQSDVDQAQVRDLKLVYDLQLDREISARREYELTVESQLRRELTSELQAHAADEVVALRAELAALRTSLEVLFGTDLSDRPALETERTAVRGYSEWDHDRQSTPADWVSSNRVTAVRPDDMSSPTEENPIIDVPEVGVLPQEQVAVLPSEEAGVLAHEPEVPTPPGGVPVPTGDMPTTAYGGPPAPPRHATADATAEANQAEAYRGSHWRPDRVEWRADGRCPEDGASAEAASPQPAPRFEPDHEPSPPQPQRRLSRRRPEPAGQDTQWQQVEDGGQWLPAGTPGSHWDSVQNSAENAADMAGAAGFAGASATANESTQPIAPVERRARHSISAEPLAGGRGETETGRQRGETGRRARARHSTESDSYGGETAAPAPPSPPPPAAPPEPAARHRSAEQSDDTAPPTGGQSVADLLARLQPNPTGGGRRRRRAE